VTRLAFANAELLDPELSEPETGTLLVEGGRIIGRLDPSERIPEDTEVIELFGRRLAPGFIDLHYHGELIFAGEETFEETLHRASASLARHGTTAFLPTSVSLAQEPLASFVTRVADALTHSKVRGARPLGLHLEGPWINPEAAGAHSRGGIRPFELAEGVDLLARADGMLAMATIAPEIEGALELVEMLAERGVAVALGHSLAGNDALDRAMERGMTHVTHLFNAMGSFHHREPGLAAHVLAEDRLTADLICDGVHVHPSVVKSAVRALGERLVLITDRVEPPEIREGTAGIALEGASQDGAAIYLADGRLAGSNLTLDRAVGNLREFAGVSLLDAVAASTLRPARVLGVEQERGTLRPRARADFAILDDDGHLSETWIEGRRVYDASDRE
jgi:N-acetylglucosamine-6-phosphate deacetylase